MKSSALLNTALILTVILAATIVAVTDARGGRRGGSFGSIFGGWRKYKKPAPMGNSRRTVNGSPMHTAGTKSASGDSTSSIKSGTQTKARASYPKQQMPIPGAGAGAGYQPNGYYGAQLPPGGAYYANTAAMPAGAIYYAQPPMRSSGSGDFLFGMMAGHVMSRGLFGHQSYGTHVYQQRPQQAENGGAKVIIINNGEGAANITEVANSNSTAQHFWPTETDVPLAPFNTSVTPEEALKPGNKPIFQRVPYNNAITEHLNPKAQSPTSAAPQPVEIAPGSIICVPMLFNETDPNDPSKSLHIERVVCYPTPPMSPVEPVNCVTQSVTETDPEDPTKTMEVLKENCSTATTQPPKVAGDIGETFEDRTVQEN